MTVGKFQTKSHVLLVVHSAPVIDLSFAFGKTKVLVRVLFRLLTTVHVSCMSL